MYMNYLQWYYRYIFWSISAFKICVRILGRIDWNFFLIFTFPLHSYVCHGLFKYSPKSSLSLYFRWLVFCLWIKKGEKLINFSKVSQNFPSCMYKKNSKNFKSSVPVDAVINFNSKKNRVQKSLLDLKKNTKNYEFLPFLVSYGKMHAFSSTPQSFCYNSNTKIHTDISSSDY